MDTKKIYIIVFLLLISGLFFAYKMYNKPHVDVADAKAQLTVNASTITSDFSLNEDDANAKYLEKIVQVSGVLKSVKNEEGKTILSIGNPDEIESVMCHLLASENTKAAHLTVGKTITVKGICTGYLLDVILVNGVIKN